MNPVSCWRGEQVVAAFLALITVPAAAQVITPVSGTALTVAPLIVNADDGDQIDPHVSGDIACYTDIATSQIRYYRFSTGIDSAMPSNGGVIDILCGVSKGLITFSRISVDRNAVMVFDPASQVLTEVDPHAGSDRLGVAIGGNTVAYVDLTTGDGDIFSYDASTHAIQTISTDPAAEHNPNVSPDGNVIVWERCLVSLTNCDVMKAVRASSASVWTVSPIANSSDPEANPDTDGTTIAYDAVLTGNPTGQDIYFVPVAGGATRQLALPGDQQNPSIRSGIIAFESRATPNDATDLFVYVIATNTVYQVTNSPSVDETLNSMDVLPDGSIRLVWTADDGTSASSNIYAATFTLPSVLCKPLQLVASVTYVPSHCLLSFCTKGVFIPTPDVIKPDPPVIFPLPTKLPVVQGNAGAGVAALLFAYKRMTSVCYYQGANGGSEYDLLTCNPSNNPGNPGGEAADTIALALGTAFPSGVTKVRVVLPVLNCGP